MWYVVHVKSHPLTCTVIRVRAYVRRETFHATYDVTPFTRQRRVPKVFLPWSAHQMNEARARV
jgi:hypothetical protein